MWGDIGHTAGYFLERAQRARERAAALREGIAKHQEIKLAESYEALARESRINMKK